MRALVAAAIGLAAALTLVLTVTSLGAPPGETSPKPLLTTVPGPQEVRAGPCAPAAREPRPGRNRRLLRRAPDRCCAGTPFRGW